MPPDAPTASLNQHPCVRPMLDLSTAHMPKPRREIVAGKATNIPDFEGLRWVEHEHGWIVFVHAVIGGQLEVLDPDDPLLPAWMQQIYRIAVAADAILINFDEAGPRYPDLPNWKE